VPAAFTGEEARRSNPKVTQLEHAERTARQCRYLETLSEHLDVEVLRSDEMWR
jgi:hypothetical protein